MLDVESHQDYLTLIFVEKVSPAVALIAQMWQECRVQKYLQVTTALDWLWSPAVHCDFSATINIEAV